MRPRSAAALASIAAIVVGLLSLHTAASAVPRANGQCGELSASSALADPPNVIVADLPRNAAGDHELVLAAHDDGVRLCYRYNWNGVEQTTPPTIRVHRGERFALRLVNDLTSRSRGESVSSRVLPPCMPMRMQGTPLTTHVGYLNHLVTDRVVHTEPDTNIHLHGFQGPASQENVFLSTLSTPMRACEYRIQIPPGQSPGTYFYHSHAHGLSDMETSLGLDGIWIVEPDAPVAQLLQHVVILRNAVPEEDDNMFAPGDVGFLRSARHEQSLPEKAPPVYDPFRPPPWPSALALRAGNAPMHWTGCNSVFDAPLVSVNGSAAPVRLDAPAGSAVLLRTLNGTADSFKTLRLQDRSGRDEPMRIMALDGTPVGASFAEYITRYSFMLPPSGRADILVSPKLGTDLILYSAHDCSKRGPYNGYALRHDLVLIHPVPSSAAASNFTATPAIIEKTPAAKLVAYVRSHPQVVRKRALTYTEYIFAKSGKTRRHISFYITDTTNATFQEHQFWPVYAKGASVPQRADIVVKRGAIEEWTLFNSTLEAHTFHIHQMSFVAENQDGIPLILDDVIVPFGKLLPNKADPDFPLIQPGWTRVLLDFRHVPRGTFVFHCHILQHEDGGMMGVIRVT